MARRFAFALCVFTTLTLSSAHATQNTISFSDSIPTTTTNWSDSVSIGKFDTNLGTLCKITFELSGSVSGAIQVESLDNAPSTVTSTLTATITLTRPDLSVIAVIVPAIVRVDNVSAFDGTIDFGGTSGASHLNLMSGSSTMTMSPPPVGDLALFAAAGGGTIALPVTAIAASTATGSGNLVTLFQTLGEAMVTVTYTYKTSMIPEPSAVVSASIGILGLAALRIRRRSQFA